MMFSYARLLELISDKGMTRGEVSDAIGISKTAFTNKLKGRTNFSSQEIANMCNLLGIERQSIGSYFFTPKV